MANPSDINFGGELTDSAVAAAEALAVNLNNSTQLKTRFPVLDYAVASRTIAASDIAVLGRYNYASTISVTLPNDAAAITAVGDWGVCEAIGVGQITFVAGDGVTINSFLTYKSTAASYCPVMWHKTAANTYMLVGRLAP